MAKQRHGTAALLGLLIAGGTLVTAGPASASAAAGQRLGNAPSIETAVVTGALQRPPRCRFVRGHWRWDRRRGRRVWVPRHRICR
jgi:hypothetical protein